MVHQQSSSGVKVVLYCHILLVIFSSFRTGAILLFVEITSPVVDSCPNNSIIHVAATPTSPDDPMSEVTVEVAKPNIVFRVGGASGPVTRHSCSHFVNGRTDRFAIGRHTVTCSAFDPTFTNQRPEDPLPPLALCQFDVDVTGEIINLLPSFLHLIVVMFQSHDARVSLGGTPTAASEVMPAHWLLSSAVRNSDDSARPVQFLMLSSVTCATFLSDDHQRVIGRNLRRQF